MAPVSRRSCCDAAERADIERRHAIPALVARSSEVRKEAGLIRSPVLMTLRAHTTEFHSVPLSGFGVRYEVFDNLQLTF